MSDYYNQDNRYDSGEAEGDRGLGSFFKGNNNQQQQQQQRPNQYAPPQGPPPGPSGPSQSHYGQNPYGNSPQGPRPGSNMVGGSQYGGNMPGGGYSQEEIDKNQRNERYKDWGTKAGIAALGAAAIGAAAYGIHEWREDKEEEKEEEEKRKREEEETKARLRREEEERRRREQQQQQQHHQGSGYGGGYHQQQQQQHHQPSPPRYGSDSGGGFQPPVPMGCRPYTYDQNDVRHANPARSSENSPTPREYPQLRHVGNDNTIKMGSIIALKHNMTGRFLHTDRSHSTQTGSNQQLVFGFRWNPDENDWWQVLPANHDVPVPGAIVSYGTQIRLRHLQTGRHLHSHYNYRDPKCGQNEITAYGDQTLSDENDHWVVERWGTGSYGQTWDANDAIVLRHYVSGMTLHSHDIMFSEDVQSVTCFGPGGEENDKWRVKFE
ncbi:hypothetical protein GGF40_000688 [Coemansia sp. RSA 1286]|nr:hypothetical protein IWW45_000425 [Coemansia sp. RSA 485]KAJ2603554.1 hypothetical protein GGF39_000047 [Coemansia sp. RSA 1721]KAJ2639722.1 hypothetical protein GGF40_000688 [Coemansia sp. RSA 1286]